MDLHQYWTGAVLYMYSLNFQTIHVPMLLSNTICHSKTTRCLFIKASQNKALKNGEMT